MRYSLIWATTVAMITVTGGVTVTLLYGHWGAGILGAAAACLGGLSSAFMFGHKGLRGVILAALACLFATSLCPALIGLAMGRPFGALTSVRDVFAALIYQPDAGLVWIMMMACVHVINNRLRRLRFDARNKVFLHHRHIPALIEY